MIGKIILKKYIFLSHLEPSKEAGSPLLFSRSFFPDFYMKKKFWRLFGGKKAIYDKKNHESGLLKARKNKLMLTTYNG